MCIKKERERDAQCCQVQTVPLLKECSRCVLTIDGFVMKQIGWGKIIIRMSNRSKAHKY